MNVRKVFYCHFSQRFVQASTCKNQQKGDREMSVLACFGRGSTYYDARESFDDDEADAGATAGRLKECEAKNKQLAMQVKILSGGGLQPASVPSAPYARRAAPAGPPTTAFASSQRL
jgi:hypothetical protein